MFRDTRRVIAYGVVEIAMMVDVTVEQPKRGSLRDQKNPPLVRP